MYDGYGYESDDLSDVVASTNARLTYMHVITSCMMEVAPVNPNEMNYLIWLLPPMHD